jgi:hypothetical protein
VELVTEKDIDVQSMIVGGINFELWKGDCWTKVVAAGAPTFVSLE